jgi:hypothetical protein
LIFSGGNRGCLRGDARSSPNHWAKPRTARKKFDDKFVKPRNAKNRNEFRIEQVHFQVTQFVQRWSRISQENAAQDIRPPYALETQIRTG